MGVAFPIITSYHAAMIERDIQNELQACCHEYPVVTITGPRQAGKTTLARTTFAHHKYVSFEQPMNREYFHEDPLGFLNRYASGAVFDEVQHVPDLLSYLQQEVDERPTPGRFILTGSQNFALSARISQSLAGRTCVLELLPFSITELQRGHYLSKQLNETLWQGSYPPVHDRTLRPQRWYSSYMATYIDRDIRQLTAVHDLDTFHRFMRLIAGNVGQLLNSSRLAGDCGVDHKTIRRWLNILQASYIACLLPPYYNNLRKRIVKTPKIYFYDTGLICSLLGISDPHQLETHPLRGAIFENWIFSELTKKTTSSGENIPLYFWRTHGGQEVDFLFENKGIITGIEVKSGMTARPSMARPLLNTLHQWENMETKASVVFGGNSGFSANGCDYVPWTHIASLIG
ncbi:MAG: ATP-binding protein [Spartobacteria bacterium]|nr:ATP-binding protein [Spartobacteria bacterium]